MKKLILFLILLLCITGCTKKEEVKPVEEESETQETTETIPEEQDSEDFKVLVICFSMKGEQYSVGVIEEGNTYIVAQMIREYFDADYQMILPEEGRYPDTYKELTEVAKAEQNENARPPLRIPLLNPQDYDLIFIGAPVWWGDWPMIMYTVFENNDFSGKTLVPFCTHEGSGLSGFDKKLQDACPDSTVLKGLAIRGSDAQNKRDDTKKVVEDFLKESGY